MHLRLLDEGESPQESAQWVRKCVSFPPPCIVKAEGVVFLRGFRSHARQSVGESQEHPRSGERGYVWLRLRRARHSVTIFRVCGIC